MDLISLLTDPLLRAPTWGSMLMCLTSSLVGVVVVIQKRSLIGEALSHACYPGVVLGVLLAATLFPASQQILAIAIILGATLMAFFALLCIEALERRFKIKPDAALCAVLSLFFGVGLLIASRLQFTHGLWYKQIQLFLYGQVATMTDIYILIYGVLALLTLLFLFSTFPQIEAVYFDRAFATSVGIKVRLIDMIVFALLVLAIVIGMRSVGLILMSGMLIAPAVAARQFVKRLSSLFLLAGGIGTLSGLLGNYFSFRLSLSLQKISPSLSLPTGPMIVLTAAAFCTFSLLFAPRNGFFFRLYRKWCYKGRCLSENLLKALWKAGGPLKKEAFEKTISSSLLASLLLLKLKKEGWIEKQRSHFLLTSDGKKRAEHIVRLHRLWEVYLVDYLGQKADKVHRSAEQMEHVITPELEEELTLLMNDPKKDPHQQPIPAKKGDF